MALVLGGEQPEVAPSGPVQVRRRPEYALVPWLRYGRPVVLICAAGLYFRRWAGQWYLEINPTYHFTIDGRRDSYYDAEYVAKIKRMERNSAVYQLVRAWADYLLGEDTLFKSRDERILFGNLLTIDADAAIDERAWLPPPDPPALAPADVGLLAGLWEEP